MAQVPAHSESASITMMDTILAMCTSDNQFCNHS